MFHHVNFVKRLRLLSLENQSDYHWFVLLHNCLNYNKLPSLFLESSCVYGLRSTDSNIYSVPKIMRTCSAGGFPYAVLYLTERILHHNCKRSFGLEQFCRRLLVPPVSVWAGAVHRSVVMLGRGNSRFPRSDCDGCWILWKTWPCWEYRLSPCCLAKKGDNCIKFYPQAAPVWNISLTWVTCFCKESMCRGIHLRSGLGQLPGACGTLRNTFEPLWGRLSCICICVVIVGQVFLMWGTGVIDSHKSCVSCREKTSPRDLNPYTAVRERDSVQGNSSLKSVGFEHVPIIPCLMLCLCSNTSSRGVWVCCYRGHKPISNGKGIRRKLSLLTSCSVTACGRALVFFLCSTEYQLLLSAGY